MDLQQGTIKKIFSFSYILILKIINKKVKKMDKREIFSIIAKLSSKRAPSGLESERGEIFKDEIKKIFSDKLISVNKDSIGNYFLKLKGTSSKKKIAIFAHLDEIGGTIRKINKKGRLEFSQRGGYEGRWLISRKVLILNREGKWINGVIGGRPPHATPEKLREKEKIEVLELEIFIGALTKDEVINKYKIHVGAPFVFSGEVELLNPDINDDIISGYSLDNLLGLAGLIILVKKIQKNLLNDFGNLRKQFDLFIVATVREEIGTEGALFFARNNTVDEVIALDIGLVTNFPGGVSSDITLTGGPTIIWQELRGLGVFDYELCRKLVKIAEENNLKYQNAVLEYYGSDSGKIQKWLGMSSGLIGIPSMFSHNVPEISTLSGIEEAAELIFQYLKSQK
jgi:putative aminopeptidase FrvX